MRRFDERFAGAAGINDPGDECGSGDGRGVANPRCSEPIHFLPFVEDHLQAAGPDNEEAEAKVVKFARLGVPDIRRIVDEAADHESGKNADGDVDIEGVSPAIGVCEPSAERGAEDGSDHDTEGEDSHGLPALPRFEAFEEDGLGERLERAAAGTLNDAREQHQGQAGRGSATERCRGEDEDTRYQEPLAPEAQGKPVAGRKDDGVGNEVAGEDPGGFAVGGRKRTGDVGQGDGDDGGIEHLHKRRQHYGGGNQPRRNRRALRLTDGGLRHTPLLNGIGSGRPPNMPAGHKMQERRDGVAFGGHCAGLGLCGGGLLDMAQRNAGKGETQALQGPRGWS